MLWGEERVCQAALSRCGVSPSTPCHFSWKMEVIPAEAEALDGCGDPRPGLAGPALAVGGYKDRAAIVAGMSLTCGGLQSSHLTEPRAL